MVLDVIHPAALVLLAAVLAWRLPRNVGHALGVVATASAAAISWFAPEGTHYAVDLFGTFPAVLYNVDQFSALMGLIFGFIGAMAVLYSWYSGADRVQTAFALGYVGTSFGTVFAGDWLTMIFFWELMAVTSTLLVWHYGGAAVRAGFRYALLHGIGGSLLLAAIVWQYAEVGSLLFSASTGMEGTTAQVLAAVGIGVNVGFVGLHAWLPDTYPRPHVAASVFLCVFTTKTGVYGMFRAFPEGHLWIAYMGGAMAVFGAFAALLQSDMRRLLSYHIQSQVGYMIAGVGIGTSLAVAGAFGHVFNHILYKSLLFMAVGVVIYRTGEESLDEIGGLGRTMPFTAITFTVAALSIAGFPGFNGFVSKGIVIAEAHHYEKYEALWYLLLLGGVGTFLSFIKLGYFAFVEGSYDGEVKDANVGQSVGMGLVAALCVLLGIYPAALFEILPNSHVLGWQTFESGHYEFEVFTASHLIEGVALAAAGLVGFAILRAPLHRIGTVPDVDWLYNRAGFVGTRWFVILVTELYAVVDRGAVWLADTSMTVASDPEAYVRRVPGSERALGEPGERYRPLRSGIGRSILLVTLVATVVLVAVLSG
ncbi:monovalent cation/H+ antiporter subunit D [Salinarchaeum sp. Harcht-Bsk1]|uniref:Na(+)/H(+) antiporter subunit D n=1 Tax=Salinarchaeum sp. Harcht-Bsk1 TaxID=1333523 RepID=UPI0003424393|nr:Na(+)/H(+) antiporter subunit D [Salinarchaeum sp. Harcht-Bsk1]AGN00091.1 monovalent cation/H+ antiporter subunit D [Salinarchaeum sp. Harcht-Bsk1]